MDRTPREHPDRITQAARDAFPMAGYVSFGATCTPVAILAVDGCDVLVMTRDGMLDWQLMGRVTAVPSRALESLLDMADAAIRGEEAA